jgi:hypothetical protein
MNSSKIGSRVDEWICEDPGPILVLESLDGRWRTDAKRGDEAGRLAEDFVGYDRNRAREERDWPVHRTAENSGVRHRADRTLMAGKLGILGVYMDRLDDAGEGDQQDTQQRQSCNERVLARLVSR